MAILLKSQTALDSKDFWATSWSCYFDAVQLYGRPFACDVAAEPNTAKCQRYYARAELLDGLLHPASRDGIRQQLAQAEASGIVCDGLDSLNLAWPHDYWCNPPFGQKAAFIAKAREAQKAGHSGMMLLPYEPLTKWWRELLAMDVIIYEPDGRYQFLERDGVTQKNGANFGCALVLFPACRLGLSVRVPYSRGVWEVA